MIEKGYGSFKHQKSEFDAFVTRYDGDPGAAKEKGESWYDAFAGWAIQGKTDILCILEDPAFPKAFYGECW